MTPVSFADITYDQGLQLLALRKQALDAGQIRRMTPEALANTFVLRDTGDRFVEKVADDGLLAKLKSGIENLSQRASAGWGGLDAATKNVLKSTAIGGGLGAGAGLGKAMLSGEDSYGPNILRGGAAGAALGGGLGLALSPDAVDNTYDRVRKLYEQYAKPKEEAATPTPASSTEAASAPTRPTYAQIKDEFPGSSPAEQKQTAQKLIDRANTRDPENYFNLKATVGTGVGLGLGGRRLVRKPKTYDPAELAKNIVTRYAGAGIKNFSNEQANAIAQLVGEPITGKTADRVRKLYSSNKPNGQQLLESLLPKATTVDRILRRTPKAVTEQLATLFPDAPNAASKAVKEIPIWKNRRVAGGLAALGGVEGALRYLGIDPMQTYNKGVADREQARQTLNYLLGK